MHECIPLFIAHAGSDGVECSVKTVCHLNALHGRLYSLKQKRRSPISKLPQICSRYRDINCIFISSERPLAAIIFPIDSDIFFFYSQLSLLRKTRKTTSRLENIHGAAISRTPRRHPRQAPHALQQHAWLRPSTSQNAAAAAPSMI